MTFPSPAVWLAAGAGAVLLLAVRFARELWPSRLERQIALRYLRSHRSSRLVSLITLIPVGGVTVGVMALAVVLGVTNGLQSALRDQVLLAHPHPPGLTA